MAELQTQQKKPTPPTTEHRAAAVDTLAPETEQITADVGKGTALHASPLAHPTARGLRQANVLQMQRSLGNAHFQRTLASARQAEQRSAQALPLQTKLKVNTPGDRYEQEADRVAAQVMTMPEPAAAQPVQQATAPAQPTANIQAKPLARSITAFVRGETAPAAAGRIPISVQEGALQRKCAKCEQEAARAQAKPEEGHQHKCAECEQEERAQAAQQPPAVEAADELVQAKSAPQSAHEQGVDTGQHLNDRLTNNGGGSPLSDDVRAFMEPRFGTDFSHVRVHTSSDAARMSQDLNAQAFTHKQDIYFGAGKYPGKNDLTAHELTHVVQQTGAAGTQQASAVNVQLKCADCEEEQQLQRKEIGAGVASASPQLDTSSSEGLLQSIAATPASSFGPAVNQSKGAATQIESQEKADLADSLPEVERPTGLPRSAEPPRPDATHLPAGQPPEPKGATGRAGTPLDTKHAEPQGPTPGSNVSTAVSAPPKEKEDGGGSWWNWLTGRVQGFLGSITTHDTGLSTSAGPRPNVDLSGEADPAQTTQQQQASTQEVTSRKATADQAISANFGENAIYPTVPTERLKSAYKPSGPNGAKGGGAATPPALPEDMRANFDQMETPKLSVQVHEQAADYRQQKAKYQQEAQATREQGQQRIAQETEQTRLDQQKMQQQARGDVDGERQRWQAENRKIHDQYSDQSQAKRLEIDRQVHEKVQSTEKEADGKFTEAEQKAETERKNTERQAADKKREAESKPRSFWEGVKDSISSVFDDLRQVVSGLFEGLRKVVKAVIETAKAAVHVLIEAARSVVVNLIKGFGELVKGLASIALAAFPEAAANARAWIDKRVDSAVTEVNSAAERLKKAADAALDWVGEKLDQGLSALQAGFNMLLDGLEFLAKAPFEIMELLGKLADTLKQFGPFIDGLKELINNPGLIEAAAKESVQGYIDQIPPKAHEVIQEAIQKVGGAPTVATAPAAPIQRQEAVGAPTKKSTGLQKHLEGIWRHLEPGLKEIQANWWTQIKQMLWNLVWPFNEKSPLKKDFAELIKLPGQIWDSVADGNISQAVDQFLQLSQKINSVVGLFYGWFFIASVIVGAVIGSIVPGPGTVAGALAGATFAGEVGEGLLIAMIATETAVIGKAVFDLAFGPGTEKVNESAYDRIASSGLTLGITGVFMVLSAIASDIASELVEGVKGLFKGGEAPEAPGLKVDAPEVKTDAPEVKADAPEGATEAPEAKAEAPEVKDLGSEGGQKVLAEEPTPDGHKVKVTEDGECLICSDCIKIRQDYAEELKLADADPEVAKIRDELNAADSMPADTPEQAQLKAEAEAKVRQDLEAVRAKQGNAPEAKQVDLTDDKARKHILDGDETGGGHRHGTGEPGKSEFPSDWSDQKILHEISDIATDPSAKWTQQTGSAGAKFTKSGKPVRWKVEGTRNGIDITVIVEPDGRGIVTGFPTNTPPNPL